MNKIILEFLTALLDATGPYFTLIFIVIMSLISTVGVTKLCTVVWRFLFGHFITDVASTQVSLRRAKSDGNFDDLVVNITIRKGRINALTLQFLEVHVLKLKEENLKAAEAPLKDIPRDRSPEGRSLNGAGELYCTRKIFAFWPPDKDEEQKRKQSFNLVPHERLQYASFCRIPRDATCEVIVTLHGNRYLRFPLGRGKIFSIDSAITIPSDAKIARK